MLLWPPSTRCWAFCERKKRQTWRRRSSARRRGLPMPRLRRSPLVTLTTRPMLSRSCRARSRSFASRSRKARSRLKRRRRRRRRPQRFASRRTPLSLVPRKTMRTPLKSSSRPLLSYRNSTRARRSPWSSAAEGVRNPLMQCLVLGRHRLHHRQPGSRPTQEARRRIRASSQSSPCWKKTSTRTFKHRRQLKAAPLPPTTR
mmetsp:Transcript_47450/g.103132  ORF Transcript_47450/g.103132 Transcript_47450/m.103132 type:complete len:201 (-) Transcript_47450:411-1013(-)